MADSDKDDGPSYEEWKADDDNRGNITLATWRLCGSPVAKSASRGQKRRLSSKSPSTFDRLVAGNTTSTDGLKRFAALTERYGDAAPLKLPRVGSGAKGKGFNKVCSLFPSLQPHASHPVHLHTCPSPFQLARAVTCMTRKWGKWSLLPRRR